MASHWQQISWTIWSFINLNTIPYNMSISNHWVPVAIAKSATGNLFTPNPPTNKNNKKSNDDTTKMTQRLTV